MEEEREHLIVTDHLKPGPVAWGFGILLCCWGLSLLLHSDFGHLWNGQPRVEQDNQEANGKPSLGKREDKPDQKPDGDVRETEGRKPSEAMKGPNDKAVQKPARPSGIKTAQKGSPDETRTDPVTELFHRMEKGRTTLPSPVAGGAAQSGPKETDHATSPGKTDQLPSSRDGAADEASKEEKTNVLNREVVAFVQVEHETGYVITGWVYRDGSDGEPIRKYCYWRGPGQNERAETVSIGEDGNRLADADTASVPDPDDAWAKCRW
jgi:hypothetical protein